jgi:hypothetical protein
MINGESQVITTRNLTKISRRWSNFRQHSRSTVARHLHDGTVERLWINSTLWKTELDRAESNNKPCTVNVCIVKTQLNIEVYLLSKAQLHVSAATCWPSSGCTWKTYQTSYTNICGGTPWLHMFTHTHTSCKTSTHRNVSQVRRSTKYSGIEIQKISTWYIFIYQC